MSREFVKEGYILKCPKCGFVLLHAKIGEFEVTCSNPKCECKWGIAVDVGKINYTFLDRKKD